MVSDEQIKEAALYYINNPVNISEASEHFNISKRTFQLYMKKLESISNETFKLYKDKRSINVKIGQKHGGYFGKKESSYSKEDIESLATHMISNNLTYSQLSKSTGISSSYLHELISNNLEKNSELKHDFDSFMELHKVDKTGSIEPIELMNKYRK